MMMVFKKVEVKEDEIAPDYTFTLTNEQRKDLKEKMSIFEDIKDDFGQTNAMILGDTRFVTTGKKSIKEMKSNSTVIK